jgi:hypothetical protein
MRGTVEPIGMIVGVQVANAMASGDRVEGDVEGGRAAYAEEHGEDRERVARVPRRGRRRGRRYASSMRLSERRPAK